MIDRIGLEAEVARLTADLAAEREKAFTAMRVFERYRELEAEIEKLRAELAAANAEADRLTAERDAVANRLENALSEGAKRREERDAARAELAARDELLKEARESWDELSKYPDPVIRKRAVNMIARIDAALGKGESDGQG